MGHRELPVELALPNRLVLLPHTYGHNPSFSYMQVRAIEFPGPRP